MASSRSSNPFQHPSYDPAYQYSHANYPVNTVNSAPSLDTRTYSDDSLIPYAVPGGSYTSTPFYPQNIPPTIPPHHGPTFSSGGYDPSLPANPPIDLYQPAVHQQGMPQPYQNIPFPSYPVAATPTPPPPAHTHMHTCEWRVGRCTGLAPGKNRDMGEHLREFHGFTGNEKDIVRCYWGHCDKQLQRMNMGRHIVSTHLRETTTCPRCNKTLSRPDVASRHEKQCGK